MSEFHNAELAQRQTVAEAAVEAAGQLRLLDVERYALPLRRGERREIAVREGLDIHATLSTVIHDAFPNDLVVSESQQLGPHEMEQSLQRCWLLDPLNGGRDGFPVFGPAVTYVADGRPLAAAIRLPFFHETLSAAAGQGATLNGKRLQVAAARPLTDAFIVGTGYDLARPRIEDLLGRLSGWRLPTGLDTPSIALCYLATGRIDGLVQDELGNPRPWQLAAGTLIVREAGGWVAGFNGEYDLMSPGLIAASNEALVNQLQEWASLHISNRR